jgi:hypothetical protein
MAQQFAKKRIPANPMQDKRIATDFGKNIQSVVKFYTRRKIPVFVYEPVCNLIDMPPFSSEGEENIASFVKAYHHLFTNTRLLAQKLAQDGVLEKLKYHFPSNAHVLYLEGLLALEKGEPFLDILEKAKDLDTTPFRYRSEIREALYTLEHQESSNRYFVFIPLREEIIHRYGSNAFDNTLFIDHLHFKRKGQHLLAQLFCEYWLGYSHTPSNALVSLRNFFSTPDQVEKGIFYHSYYDYEAESRVAGLLMEPPYSLMLLPYQRKGSLLSHPFLLSNSSEITRYLAQTNDFLKVYFTYLYNKQKFEEMASLINAIRQVSPAHPQSYYNIAIFLSTTNAYSEEAAQAWLMAILLSEKTNQNILSNAIRYFSYHHKEDILRQWRIKR